MGQNRMGKCMTKFFREMIIAYCITGSYAKREIIFREAKSVYYLFLPKNLNPYSNAQKLKVYKQMEIIIEKTHLNKFMISFACCVIAGALNPTGLSIDALWNKKGGH